jgi:hypothetical protein
MKPPIVPAHLAKDIEVCRCKRSTKMKYEKYCFQCVYEPPPRPKAVKEKMRRRERLGYDDQDSVSVAPSLGRVRRSRGRRIGMTAVGNLGYVPAKTRLKKKSKNTVR